MKTTLLSAALMSCVASVQAQDYKWQAFYTQTYETVQAIGDVWVSGNQNGLQLVEEEENGNHYMLFDNGDQNSRGLYNLDALTADMYEGIDEYRLEFDMALTPGTKDNTQFAVGSGDLNAIGGDWITPGADIAKNINKGPGSGVLLYLFQSGANSTQWRLYSQTRLNKGNADESLWTWNPYIEDDDCSYVTMTAGTFYHFAITVTPHAGDEGWTHDVKVEVTDMDGETVVITNDFGEELESVTLPYTDEGSGAWFKQFFSISGRYKSGMKMDNIQVMKKVEAGAVAVPTLSMTGLNMESRIVSLDNGMSGEGLTPYYMIVDEDTYNTATSAAGLTGTPYTAPFIVSEEINYVLAWNVNAEGKASELYRFTCEAGWAAQLNEPTIKAYDYVGYKKTYTASCYQGDVQPFAPLEYTIYMSNDSINWEATTTLTVESGKVYAKVEADGYAAAACEGVEVPEGAYGSTKISYEGIVITNQDGILDEETGESIYNFGKAGSGRVEATVAYWAEDADDYDAANAVPFMKRSGIHVLANGGTGNLMIIGSGNGSGFTVTGISVYGNRNAGIKIDNLSEGDIIQLTYNNGTANVLTVDDPETFVVPIPQYGNYGAGSLATIAIKGEGTVETREVKLGEWGIISSSRNVADVDRAGAVFYEHVYTIYNDETLSADTLLLQPVKELKAGCAYIYQATSDVMELVTLAAEEPVDEQPDEQFEYEYESFVSTVGEPYEDSNLYTMQPNGILMKNEQNIIVPQYSGFFQNLDPTFRFYLVNGCFPV